MHGLRKTAFATLLIALSGFGAETMAQGGCVSRGEGQQMVAQGQVLPFPEAARRAGIADNQVVDVQLCQGSGGYIYRVRLRDGGQANIPAG